MDTLFILILVLLLLTGLIGFTLGWLLTKACDDNFHNLEEEIKS